MDFKFGCCEYLMSDACNVIIFKLKSQFYLICCFSQIKWKFNFKFCEWSLIDIWNFIIISKLKHLHFLFRFIWNFNLNIANDCCPTFAIISYHLNSDLQTLVIRHIQSKYPRMKILYFRIHIYRIIKLRICECLLSDIWNFINSE